MLSAFGVDPDLATRFASACRKGAPAVRELVLPVRTALERRGHRFATHGGQFEETAEALFDLAGELLPDAAGAARARLRERVAASADARRASAVEAIEALVAEEYVAFDYLVMAAGEDDGAVLRAARHLWSMLRERGQRHEPQDFSRHVRAVLAGLFLPSASPREEEPEEEAAQPNGRASEEWIAWQADICRRVLAYVVDRAPVLPPDAPLDLAEAHAIEDEMDAAAGAEDRDAYLRAARRWASALRRAAERARREMENGRGGER
ncbi:MAG: hypothetical protein M3P49_14160 [Actinomycetota bacterium]|nr:hypothetical protein [Actinomycetota bacterium]